MREITLVFPDQLFEHHPALNLERTVYLVEEFLYFRVQTFHKQRLVLLRASMKTFAANLVQKGYSVEYIDSFQLKKRGDLFTILHKNGVKSLHFAEFSDDWLQADLDNAAELYSWNVTSYPSPMFLCSHEEIEKYFKGKSKFSMAQFYIYQRRKLNILMDDDGRPVGGKYSYDTDNRKKLPKKLPLPEIYLPKQSDHVDEAIKYVEQHFSESVGQASPFLYASSHVQASLALFNFIEHRLVRFGDYEDAISQNESVLFHSLLSPLLNIGLLTPIQVVNALLEEFKTVDIPINSLEGFLRQIIGWREFIHACYRMKGKKMRSSNHFGFKSALPKGFWEGNTGILPIDNTIKKVLRTGYCHHIERLMILGNFLLLTECDPDAIYEWFMANFVDAYDWVMVANVYAMSQYADCGTITTKPYVSGSNYILKMSDYSKGQWCDLWDGLFWRFISKQQALFESNPRTKVLIDLRDKNEAVIDIKIEWAEKWLTKNGNGAYMDFFKYST